jgi:hypothetical protein
MARTSLRTVGSVIEEIADREGLARDVDPRVQWALLDPSTIAALEVWVAERAVGRASRLTARFSGPGRMLLVEAETPSAWMAMVMLPTQVESGSVPRPMPRQISGVFGSTSSTAPWSDLRS